MKSIKKLSLVVMALVLSVGFVSAQVGIEAGYSSSKVKDAKESLNGFHVGPTFELGIQGPISLQYGLLYNMYIKKNDSFLGSGDKKTGAENKVTAHQIDIPVRVAFTLPVTSDFKVFLFGGPNFNIGIASQNSTQAWALGKKVGDVVKINAYDDKDFSRFNLQLGVGGGLQYHNFGVKASYDWGMLDMHKSDVINYKVNGLKVGLFYNF